ncbi:beclin-1-like isoform X1 [Porites lutea]|uniref:beclin-1-like isoform X1 n=1 Tax=Porites lutea TaxID=51062 RepID=UPI003CC552DC
MASAKEGRGTTYVSFVCQRCYQPLKLDHSLLSLDGETIAELTAPFPELKAQRDDGNESGGKLNTSSNQSPDTAEDENVEHACRIIPPTRLQSLEGGFTVIGDSQPNNTENLSHRLKVTTLLFDIMSGQSEVDHPLCEECTDTLLDQLDEQLKITEDELKDYKVFFNKLNDKPALDTEGLSKELTDLRKEEEELIRKLEEVEKERENVAKKMEMEKERSKQLEEEERKYWLEYSEYQKELLECEDDQQSVDNQMRYAQAQLDKLKKTNVFNSTFHIWHKGHFGTINNFRLGRLPSVPVEWSEINAAWGQTVLLLHSLARKMNLTFERYRLVPYGNHSYLESLTDKSKDLPLYGSGGFRFFWDTKFDQAMVGFLDCLQQFKEAVAKVDKRFCLPYRMEKGKIYDSSGSGGAFSIKIQFNSEEQWTKALKFVLTNLKWGLAWVSSQFTEK